MAGPAHKGHLWQDDWLTDIWSPDAGVPSLDPGFAAMAAPFDRPIQPYQVNVAAAPNTACMAPDTIGASHNIVAVSPHTPILFGGAITNTTTTIADDNSDIAMGGSLARSEFGVDGSGITIGILSDSFNINGGMTTDISAGNLPAANMISIIKEGPAGSSDEGRAMAQLIHRVAPGASIDFYTAFDSEADFAAGIQTLAADGCKIIVDDVTYFDEPFFQDGSAIQTAVENVINDGVSYFTAAGNEASNFYEHSWTSNTFTLPTFGKQTAFDFGIANGGTSSPFETFTVNKGFSAFLELQWDQPFKSISGTGSDDALTVDVFQNNGTSLVFTQSSTINGDPLVGISFPSATLATTYKIAITLGSGPAPGLIKMIDLDDAGSAGGGFVGGAGVGSGSIVGHSLVPGANTVGAVNYKNTPAFGGTLAVESFSSVGSGEFLFDANGNRLVSPEILNKVNFTAPDGSKTSVFNPFLGTSAAAPDAAGVAALMLQADPLLTPALITADLESTALAMNGGTATVGAGFVQAVPAVQLAHDQAGQTACYLAGTRILTPHGYRAIEDLRIGDRVCIAGASHPAPIKWIGRRYIDLARHPAPQQARPICIRRGAFGDNLPRRDLRVSPEHALFIDGALIPAALLVNDSSIVPDQSLRHVHYFHLELPRHAVLFAEDLLAESWLDTGNRSMFDNATASSHRTAEQAWRHDACAPRLTDPRRVRFVWQRLAERGRRLRCPPPFDPGLHLAIGDTVHLPVRVSSHRYVFVLPRNSGLARLRSRIASPASERRLLGVCVTRIASHGASLATDIALDSHALRDGWWDVERNARVQWRWTDGDAALTLAADAEYLEVHLTGALRYALSDAMPAAA